MTDIHDPPLFTLDYASAGSLASVLSLLPAAQLLASIALPKKTRGIYYYLFVWHVFDVLTHTIVEGSFLFHCFFSYVELPVATTDYPHPASLFSRGPHFLNQPGRRYGARYAQSPMARLWQEYAKADIRWGQADLNVISIELLTVFLAGPAAAFVAYSIAKWHHTRDPVQRARIFSSFWFVAIVLALGELYGGFMTFAPEWLSGNSNLKTDDPVYLWLYLFFFNTLWVFIPLWILYLGYQTMVDTNIQAALAQSARKSA